MSAEIVDDPFFRQRYRFSREGEALRIEIWSDAGGGVPIEHLHPRLEESWEVLEGEVTFRVEGEERRAVPGDRVVAAPGVRHSFENTGDAPARLVAEARPAMELQESIEAAAALSAAGGFTRSGMPKGIGALLDAAELAQRYRETVVLADPSPGLQRLLFPPLAALARRRRGRQ
jgi:quercetin dioxygenase-like cupin family protein